MKALLMEYPYGKPRADVFTAGNGGEIVDAAQDAELGEGLQPPQIEGSAANSAAGKAEANLAVRLRVPRRQHDSSRQQPCDFIHHAFLFAGIGNQLQSEISNGCEAAPADPSQV